MTILFKWEDKVNGRVERTVSFRNNEVIGTAKRIDGKIVVAVNVGDAVVEMVGQRATALKQDIQTRINDYAMEIVIVYSIHDQRCERPIEIRRGEVGGCCDPSTERYHTM